MEYDCLSLGKENRNCMRIRVKIDVRKPLKRKKQIMVREKCSHVRFKYERPSLFCFYCGKLGRSDSFCEAKMMLRAEVAGMGWDLTLRAQSRRAQAINSVWLREEGKVFVGGYGGRQNQELTVGGVNKEAVRTKKIDPIMGFSLEGRMPIAQIGGIDS